MSTVNEPNPPSRKKESFPKTTTIPEGWDSEPLMDSTSQTAGKNGRAQNRLRPTPQVDEELFSRRLDPFPKPNTIPNGWDLSEISE